ncbi:hypothetical protein D0T53_10455 [Dysgonomonas sp. 216]|uniref:type IX secretion system sortase PorU n=1 Tax=Dysgonomonas sp. 216 TaxID=2302934 RepID=UPI0013D4E5A6|nr:type IX secretion system sortase PorU [Dysgonomonas sp. 216]NDW19330.1 hypothetical protein [Dysgonomonas sp. 216]
MINIIKKIRWGVLSVFLLYTCTLSAQINSYAQKSVLSEGTWHKIKVGETGVYKLTYSALTEMGISNPANVKIYGYGGWLLDENFSKPFIDDLPPVSIWMSNTPENFGTDDYILFYAKGSLKWTLDEVSNRFIHKQNVYSTDSYYFITESAGAPNLMNEVAYTGLVEPVVSTFDDYYVHEKELYTLCSSGRDFFGEQFVGQPSQDFPILLPGKTSGSNVLLGVNFVGYTKNGATLSVKTNGVLQANYDIPLIKNTTTDSYAKAKEVDKTLNITNFEGGDNVLNLTYNPGSSDKNMHLNFFSYTYNRELKSYGQAVTLFRNRAKNASQSFCIKEATTNMLVFDVTDGEVVTNIQTSYSNGDLYFTASNNPVREYALVDLTKDVAAPSYEGIVENQNLHGLTNKDMVIIVQPILKAYAEQLKDLHESEGLQVHVVSPGDIYNEFSSGKPDATAYRRFMKMFYDRAATEDEKPKYLLLFGDGTYDNRFLLNGSVGSETSKQAMLLTYQSENSISDISSYTIDDYFGFLDDNSGMSHSSDVLRLGIGRLPVKLESEAKAVVDKIKNYVKNDDRGIWKNNVSFVADDVVAGSNSILTEKQHIEASEKFASYVETSFPSFIVNRLYCDLYERVSTIQGYRYPDLTRAMLQQIDNGTLIVNYLGHGSSQEWAHEYIFTKTEARLMTNKRLPLFIIASCSFGKFDGNQEAVSEILLTNPNGGAIALITSTRVVFSEKNKELNEKILNQIFEKQDGIPARLGDIVRHSKQALTSDSNKLRFMLLGDPAIRMSYPEDTRRVEVKKIKVNGQEVTEAVQFKALSDIVIEGEVVSRQAETETDFNGVLESMIFDSQQELTTRGNYSGGTGNAQAKMTYIDYTNILYSGSTDVENGKFKISFKIPKDILYANNTGKMSFYAYDTQNKYQAQGNFLNYTVGGADESSVEETNAPVISTIYLNSSDFVSGDVVNSAPIFYAEVSDDSGINLSGSLGHNVSLLIDGYKAYDLTPYYQTLKGTEGRGVISYTLDDLDEGHHTLLFRVWDVWNNSAVKSFDFQVKSKDKSALYDFSIERNPVESVAILRFKTEQEASGVDVRYEVFSLSGELMWSTTVNGNSSQEDFSYFWKLNKSNGEKLQAGIYICKASVYVNGLMKASKSEKLIVKEQ